jgi:hypothetical protein
MCSLLLLGTLIFSGCATTVTTTTDVVTPAEYIDADPAKLSRPVFADDFEGKYVTFECSSISILPTQVATRDVEKYTGWIEFFVGCPGVSQGISGVLQKEKSDILFELERKRGPLFRLYGQAKRPVLARAPHVKVDLIFIEVHRIETIEKESPQ